MSKLAATASLGGSGAAATSHLAGSLTALTDREAAWSALHGALPVGWRVRELTSEPATEPYVFTAMSPRPERRGRPPEWSVTGRRVDELEAVRALTALLAARATR